MCHLGFQQLYHQQSVQGLESPKQTVHRMVEENKATLEKVTIVGHSLGAGEWEGGEGRMLLYVHRVFSLGCVGYVLYADPRIPGVFSSVKAVPKS